MSDSELESESEDEEEGDGGREMSSGGGTGGTVVPFLRLGARVGVLPKYDGLDLSIRLVNQKKIK